MVRDMNAGPLVPKARIIPLDQRARQFRVRNLTVNKYGFSQVFSKVTRDRPFLIHDFMRYWKKKINEDK